QTHRTPRNRRPASTDAVPLIVCAITIASHALVSVSVWWAPVPCSWAAVPAGRNFQPGSRPAQATPRRSECSVSADYSARADLVDGVGAGGAGAAVPCAHGLDG